MKNSIVKLGVLSAFLFMVSCGNAQQNEKGGKQKPPTYKELLEKMDANKDGLLSKEEVKGPLKDDFAKIDTDEDGLISEAEFKKAPKPKRPERDQKQ